MGPQGVDRRHRHRLPARSLLACLTTLAMIATVLAIIPPAAGASEPTPDDAGSPGGAAAPGPGAGPSSPTGPVRAPAAIALEILGAAAAYWPGHEAALLDVLQVEVRDLPDGEVGLATGTGIVLDDDGGGRGWFVDTTPHADEEFVEGTAPAGSPAAGTVDLVTVLAHEMGHLLGLGHAEDDHDVMSVVGVPGRRSSPGDHAVDPSRPLGTAGGGTFALALAEGDATTEAVPAEEPPPAEPAAAEPVVEEPAPVEAVVAEPVVEEPAPVEAVVAEPVVEEPAPVEPAALEPVAEEPVPTDPAPTAAALAAPTAGAMAATAAVTNSGDADDQVYDLGAADDEALLAPDGGTGGLVLSSLNGTFDPVLFSTPSGSLTILGGGGTDSVTLDGALALSGALLRIVAESILVASTAAITAAGVELTASDENDDPTVLGTLQALLDVRGAITATGAVRLTSTTTNELDVTGAVLDTDRSFAFGSTSAVDVTGPAAVIVASEAEIAATSTTRFHFTADAPTTTPVVAESSSGPVSLSPGDKVIVSEGHTAGGTVGAVYAYAGLPGPVNLGVQDFDTGPWVRASSLPDGAVRLAGSIVTRAMVSGGARVEATTGGVEVSATDDLTAVVDITDTSPPTRLDGIVTAVGFDLDRIRTAVDLTRDTTASVAGTPAAAATIGASGLVRVAATGTGLVDTTVTSDLVGASSQAVTEHTVAEVQDAQLAAGAVTVAALTDSVHRGAAKLVGHEVDGSTAATISGSSVTTSSGGVVVSARDAAVLEARSGDLAVVPATVLIALTATSARNSLDRPVVARITTSEVTSAADVAVEAVTAPVLRSRTGTVAVETGTAIASAAAAVAATMSTNALRGGAVAEILDSEVDAVGSIVVTASSTGALLDAVSELSATATAGGGAGPAAARWAPAWPSAPPWPPTSSAGTSPRWHWQRSTSCSTATSAPTRTPGPSPRPAGAHGCRQGATCAWRPSATRWSTPP